MSIERQLNIEPLPVEKIGRGSKSQKLKKST